jgi:hypothetical protein
LAVRSISETQRVRYLLGLCSPEEREHIESEYFEDEDAFQEMLAAEDDLIDAYARGELVGEERRRFEKNLGSSFQGRDRVQFARAFAGIVSDTRSVRAGTFFQSPRLFQTATITTIVVLIVAFAWLVIDRMRMISELREIRLESVELSKRNDNERTANAQIPAQLTNLSPEPEQPRHRERAITVTQRATLGGVSVERITPYSSMPGKTSSRHDSTVRGTATDLNGNLVSGATVTLINSAKNFARTQTTNEDGTYVFNAIPPGTYSIEVRASGFMTALVSGLAVIVDAPIIRDVQLEVGAVSEIIAISAGAEAPINTTDATIGNTFESRRITELPLNASDVVGLLSLQPGVSSTGFVNGVRTDQSNITLDGVDVNEHLNTYLLKPQNRGSNSQITFIPNSLSWIRFRITLETAAIHDDYRIIIKTAGGRAVSSVDWTEPLTPNQTIIDTPAISTADLPSGDYVLLLMGKAPNGSFVKVAEYSFKVIKY